MTELKYEELKVFRVDYSKLEGLIQDVYGHSFSYPADQEVGHDSYKLFNVTGDVDDPDEIEQFKEDGGHYYLTSNLLEDLCSQGLIPEGNYLIETC